MKAFGTNLTRLPYDLRAMRLVTLLFSVLCFLGGCNSASSQMERDIKSSMRKLSQMLDEYWEIPVKRKSYGNSGIIVWRDKAQLSSFNERYRDEILSMDHLFLTISKENNIWSDDAAFSRGILYWLLTQVEPKKQTLEQATVVLNDFTQQPSTNIEEFTKTTMRDTFLNKHEAIVTPSLSYEENVQVIFQAHIAHLFFQMKEYEKAIKQNELIARTHPTSKYAQEYVSDQIQNIRDRMDGRLTVPEPFPE